jgi:hypothetical protein
MNRLTRLTLIALCLGAAGLAPVASMAQQEIVGVIVARETGEGLPYSVITLPSLGIRRFTDDSGRFVVRDIPVGTHVLQIRRLGYAPLEWTFHVRSGAQDSLRIPLNRIALSLAPVQVRADPVCTQPGLRAVKDSTLLIILTQLRMNGEQYRLLAEAYPFVYAHERTITSVSKAGDARVLSRDTVLLESRSDWRYQPGRILTREGRDRRGELRFNIPTLPDFADSVFLNHHCFSNGGIAAIDGSDLIQIDLFAAAHIKQPDVHGSINLDPQNFQIRRSVLRLSRSPRVRGMTGLEVTTLFREVMKSVPIVAQVHGVQTFSARRRRSDEQVSTQEFHELIGITFLGPKPGDQRTP